MTAAGETQMGNVPLGDIRPTAVRQWISDLSRGTPDAEPVGVSVVKRAHHVFSGILADAARDNLIARNTDRGRQTTPEGAAAAGADTPAASHNGRAATSHIGGSGPVTGYTRS